ncbi:MAG: ABC transporter ATP-binding protein [Verrucomicrobia bacterium]|nr:ABC transporter ATP-binding protein [Verrucomicrobiota bacterium]
MSHAALRLHNIRHSYGSTVALHGLDLHIDQGEFFGFLGPNGAGKSTLMKILAGFLRADSGQVMILGVPASNEKRGSLHQLGYVPQEIALYETLTPLENLTIFGQLQGVRGKQLASRTEELLRAVGLWDRRKDQVKTFSGGMMRRLNIAAALLHQPAILLCDEPTVGIDPQSRNAIFSFLSDLNEQGVTILYTTHYMEEVERLCDRIAIIDHGQLLACGDKTSLLAENAIGRELTVSKTRAWQIVQSLLPEGIAVEVGSSTVKILLPQGFNVTNVFTALTQAGVSDESITLRQPNLETLFLKLTGSQLRD